MPLVGGDDNPGTCSRPPRGSSLNEQQQPALEVVVAFAVIIKSVYRITGALIQDGHEEKNSSRVAEPHSVRCKLASRLAVMFHSLLMENISCDVLAWGYKVSSKLKDDGDVGSHCCFAIVFTVGRCHGSAA